jgi:ankyrin repeat protein
MSNKVLFQKVEKGDLNALREILNKKNIKQVFLDQIIRLVFSKGDVKAVKLVLSIKDRYNPSDYIKDAIFNKNIEVLKLLLNDKDIDPSNNKNVAIIIASFYGNIEAVKLLLQDKRVDPSDRKNEALMKSIENGKTEVVRLLLQDKRVDPSDRENDAIIIASFYGNIEVVKLLLQDKRVDPSDQKNEALMKSIENGKTEVVSLLLQDKRVNPSDRDNLALQFASQDNNIEIVKLLLKDERVINLLSKHNKMGFMLFSSNKEITDLLSNPELLLSNKKLYSSPKAFESVRKVINISEFSQPYDYDIEFSKDSLEHVILQNISPIGFSKSYPENENIIYPNEYRSFLCELETFNWNTNKLENLETIQQSQYHTEYIKHLFNLFGNNTQLFSDKFTDFYGSVAFIDSLISIDNSKYKNKLLNNPFRFILKSKFVEERKKNNLPIHYYNTFTLYEFGNKEYSVFYSDELLDTKNIKNRFSFIITDERNMTEGHFTFMVIDHKNKIVEYYDPHGKSISKSKQKVKVIYEAISKLFPGFTIIEFWKNTGIQTTENIEKDEEGFCVTWGIMMIHLKLLNINIKVQDLENMFINECENKKLSLYEVMLNYVYHINRIVLTNNYSKIIKLSKI